MRLWSLIAALALAPAGCAGLDLASLDDEHRTRLKVYEDSSTTPADSIAPRSPGTVRSAVAPPPTAADAATPDAPRPVAPPAFESPEPVAAPPAFESPEPPTAAPPSLDVPEPVAAAPVLDAPEPADDDQATRAPGLPAGPPAASQPPPIPEGPPAEPSRPATLLASTVSPTPEPQPQPAPQPEPDSDEPRELAFLDQIAGQAEQVAREGWDASDAPGAGPNRRGAVAATVGPHEIALAEVTEAIKQRIDRLPRGRRPTRRVVISMVQAEMEARILEALVLQQARVVLDSPSELDAMRATIAREWAESELPRILRREGMADAQALEARLARQGQSLELLQATYASRTLARELIRREGRSNPNLDAYLDDLRQRFPIQSDLLQAGRVPMG